MRNVKAKCRPKDVKAIFLPYQQKWCADRSRIEYVQVNVSDIVQA